MAMPSAETGALEMGGGYLPSYAAISGAGGAAAMASDSKTLARWWARFCGGEIVSRKPSTEMRASLASDEERYGLVSWTRTAEADRAWGTKACRWALRPSRGACTRMARHHRADQRGIAGHRRRRQRAGGRRHCVGRLRSWHCLCTLPAPLAVDDEARDEHPGGAPADWTVQDASWLHCEVTLFRGVPHPCAGVNVASCGLDQGLHRGLGPTRAPPDLRSTE